MAAADGHVTNDGATESEGLEGHGPLGVGAIAVHDLVFAGAGMTS